MRFLWKDLRYRRGRAALTVAGVASLSLMILLFEGIITGMYWQASRFVESTGADVWVSRERSGGVFVGFTLLNSETVVPAVSGVGVVRSPSGEERNLIRILDEENRNDKGVYPFIFAPSRPTIRKKNMEQEVKAVVVGYRAGKLGGPKRSDIARGRMFQSTKEYAPGQDIPMECVVSDDKSLGLEVGESIEVGGHELKVVGVVEDMMFLFDTPFIFTDINVARRVALQDVIYVNTFIVKAAEEDGADDLKDVLSDPQTGLIGVDVHTTEETIDNIRKNYVDEPMKGVRFLQTLLCIASALIVGMTAYVTTFEKTREIGIMKAVGADNGYVMRLILNQIGLMSVLGVLLAVALAYATAVAQVFPFFVLISPIIACIVSAVSLAVCLLGGWIAARRAARVDPMIAFRGEV